MKFKDLFKTKPTSDKRYIAGLVYLTFLICSVPIFLIFFINSMTQPIPFELEGECNTGKVNINFDAEFRNQAYQQMIEIEQTKLRERDGSFSGLSNNRNISLTKYNTEFYPKSISFVFFSFKFYVYT